MAQLLLPVYQPILSGFSALHYCNLWNTVPLQWANYPKSIDRPSRYDCHLTVINIHQLTSFYFIKITSAHTDLYNVVEDDESLLLGQLLLPDDVVLEVHQVLRLDGRDRGSKFLRKKTDQFCVLYDIQRNTSEFTIKYRSTKKRYRCQAIRKLRWSRSGSRSVQIPIWIRILPKFTYVRRS